MFTSKIGAVLTIVLALILLSMGIYGFLAIAENQILNVSVSWTKQSIFMVPLNPTKYGFKLAYTIEDLDPSVATISLEHITQNGNITYENTLSHKNCLLSDLLEPYDGPNQRSKSVKANRLIRNTELKCLTDSNFTLRGDKFSDSFEFV